MTAAATLKFINRYYAAFNAPDTNTMLDCPGAGSVHDVSQGERREGKKRFAGFPAHMHNCYHEQLSDIAVMTSTDGSRAATEFKLNGRYLATDGGLPPAAGQTYRLTVGAFFEVADRTITRVSTHLQPTFRRKRGFEKLDGVTTAYAWKDVGASEETEKPMQFWMKQL